MKLFNFNKNKAKTKGKQDKPKKESKSKFGLFKNKNDFIGRSGIGAVVESALISAMQAYVNDDDQPYIAIDEDKKLIYLIGLTNDLIKGSMFEKDSEALGSLQAATENSNKNISNKGDIPGSIYNASFPSDVEPLPNDQGYTPPKQLVFLPTVNTLNELESIAGPEQEYEIVSMPSDISEKNYQDYTDKGEINIPLVSDDSDDDTADEQNLIKVTLSQFKDFVKENTAIDSTNAYFEDESPQDDETKLSNDSDDDNDLLNDTDDDDTFNADDDFGATDDDAFNADDDFNTDDDDAFNDDGADTDDNGNKDSTTDTDDYDDYGLNDVDDDFGLDDDDDYDYDDDEVPTGTTGTTGTTGNATAQNDTTADAVADDVAPTDIDTTGNDAVPAGATPSSKQAENKKPAKAKKAAIKDTEATEQAASDSDSVDDNLDILNNVDSLAPDETTADNSDHEESTGAATAPKATETDKAETNKADKAKTDETANAKTEADEKAAAAPNTAAPTANAEGSSDKETSTAAEAPAVATDQVPIADQNATTEPAVPNTEITTTKPAQPSQAALKQAASQQQSQNFIKGLTDIKPSTAHSGDALVDLSNPEVSLSQIDPSIKKINSLTDKNRKARQKLRAEYSKKIDDFLAKNLKVPVLYVKDGAKFGKKFLIEQKADNEMLRKDVESQRENIKMQLMNKIDQILDGLTDPAEFDKHFPQVAEKLRNRFLNKKNMKREQIERINQIDQLYQQLHTELRNNYLQRAEQEFNNKYVPKRDHEITSAEAKVKREHAKAHATAVDTVLETARERAKPLVDEQVKDIIINGQSLVDSAALSISSQARSYSNDLFKQLKIENELNDTHEPAPTNEAATATTQQQTQTMPVQTDAEIAAEGLRYQQQQELEDAQTLNAELKQKISALQHDNENLRAANASSYERSSQLLDENRRYRQAAIDANAAKNSEQELNETLVQQIANISNHGDKGDDLRFSPPYHDDEVTEPTEAVQKTDVKAKTAPEKPEPTTNKPKSSPAHAPQL